MANPIYYKGRGTPEMYDELMDFMNYVFGFDGSNKDFKTLLPKLYKPEYDPCYNNYVITENGKLKAAIGAYDFTYSVAGTELKCRGIGNVAVHPYARSRGYMKECMNMSVEDMIRDGIDFSALGGQRQRYGYFGYEVCGAQYHQAIDRNNIDHCFYDVPLRKLEIRPLGADEDKLLDKIEALHNAQPLHAIRPRNQLFDILSNWHSTPYVIMDGKKFLGYFNGRMRELTLVNNEDFYDVIRNYILQFGTANLDTPMWNKAIIDQAGAICDQISIVPCEMFNVFNYKRVLGAYLKLKADTEPLANGRLTAFIHGYAGDCKLRITVKNQVTSVEDFKGNCDIELSHSEALNFFFALQSPLRRKIDPKIQSWFPIPLHIYEADQV